MENPREPTFHRDEKTIPTFKTILLQLNGNIIKYLHYIQRMQANLTRLQQLREHTIQLPRNTRMKYLLETCNGRLKNFKVVHESFCHGQGTSDKLKKTDFFEVYISCSYIILTLCCPKIQKIIHFTL